MSQRSIYYDGMEQTSLVIVCKVKTIEECDFPVFTMFELVRSFAASNSIVELTHYLLDETIFHCMVSPARNGLTRFVALSLASFVLSLLPLTSHSF